MPANWNVSPRAEIRMLAGFVILPPAVGLLMFGTCLGLWSAGAWIFEGQPSLAAARSLGIAVGVLAAAVVLLAGIPAVVWLIRRGRVSFRSFLWLGGGLGNLPFALIAIAIVVSQLSASVPAAVIPGAWFGWSGVVRAIALGFWIGVPSAILFWVVAIRGTDLHRAEMK